MLAAATDRFLEHGYAGTRLADVAADAGVSADTIYKTFGTKIAVLKEAFDVAISQDEEPVALLERPGPQAVHAETDPRVQVRLLARGIAEQLERLRPLDDVLQQAAAVDDEAAALRADIQERQRFSAMQTFARWIDDRGGLRSGLTVADAGRTLWALASPEVHRLMRGRAGLSPARYEAWLAGVLTRELLGPG